MDEPYRLFTSRSEFRLTVRQDNALRRLAPVALDLGMLDDREAAIVERRLAEEDRARTLAEQMTIRPEQAEPLLRAAGGTSLPHGMRIVDVAKRQGVSLSDLFAAADVDALISLDAAITAELEIKYAGYFERERAQAERLKRMGDYVLDDDLQYDEMRSLSYEARQKLLALRPVTLAQASRIPGVSPSDLQNLVLEVEKQRRLAST